MTVPAGWEEAEGRVPVSGERQLAIQSQAMRENRLPPPTVFIRECSIGRTFHADMQETQAELNAKFEDGQLLSFLITMAMPTTEHSRGNEIVDGVRVISYDIDIEPSRGLLASMGRVMQPDVQIPDVGPVRLMLRMFIVPEPEGSAQYILVCQATQVAEAADDIAAMTAFLASLAINSDLGAQ